MVAQRTAAERAAETIARIRAESADAALLQQRNADMRARIAAWETKYNMRSEDVHRAIDEGRLVESWDVCNWIMTYAIVSESETGRPSRMELAG